MRKYNQDKLDEAQLYITFYNIIVEKCPNIFKLDVNLEDDWSAKAYLKFLKTKRFDLITKYAQETIQYYKTN